VISQSNPNQIYTIKLQLGEGRSQGYTCSCPDFERRGQVGGSVEMNCKHIIAVEMFNGDYEIKEMIKQMAGGL
jgi:predicted nucleic acid-binding Zn finger protein